ncbi:diguanylate cyclase [Methylibium sp.]|uniref:diguanylate cyclase domain-containing protein n=1 Tax=Methylibium sp. TaxID=2067992 RepID=UPI0033415D3D
MSIFYDLDPKGRQALEDEAALNPLDPSKLVPTGLDGLGELAKTPGHTAARVGRTTLMAGAYFPMLADEVRMVWSGNIGRRNEFQDAYFEEGVEGLGQEAVDYWLPDADAMGGGTKALYALATVTSNLPFILGGPAGQSLFLADAGIGTATDVVRQGGSIETALTAGGINLGVNALGMQLPAAFGSGLGTRIATGAGSNLALGVAADAGTAETLRAGGLDDMAKGYRWDDPYSRGLDVLLGAAFGVAAGPGNRPIATADQRDAVLGARAHDQLTRRSLPGDPVNATGQRQHIDATKLAIEQLARGEPVSVADTIDPANFRLPEPPPAPGVATGDYVAYRRALESGGDPNARNPNSSATGADQFTEGTWLAMVERERPAWAEGLDRDQLLAERTNPERSAQMAAALDRANADALTREGLPATRHNLYAAHHFGEAAGVAFAKAAPDANMASILTPEQIKANPYLRGKTKAEVLANWDERAGKAGVTVPAARVPFDTPDALAQQRLDAFAERFDLPPEARAMAAPEFAAPRDGVTGFFDGQAIGVLDGLIARAQEHVATTGEPATFVSADVFNLGGLNEAMGNRQADANVHYRAMAQIVEAELRATGADVVPMRTGGDEFGLLAVNLDTPQTKAALARAEVKLREYVQSKGLGEIPRKGQTTPTGVGLHLGVADIRPGESPEAPRNRADSDMAHSKERRSVPRNPAEPAAEAIPGRTAGRAADGGGQAGGSGRGGDGSPGDAAPRGGESAREADDALSEARLVAAENPDAPVIVGADENGAGGRAVTLAEALEEIELERAQAERDAGGIAAAVACFLRRGATA